MARPVKNNLEYFSHDKDMRNDLRIKALRRKYSHKGYSIYVMMLEHLANCDYLQYEWSELSIELLTPDFDVDSADLVEIIDYCIKLKLFEIELGWIFSQKFYERNQAVLVGRKDFNLVNSPLSQLKANQLSKMENNTQSKVKYSKEKKKIKKRKAKVGVYFRPEEGKVYFDDGTSQDLGERQLRMLASQELKPYEIEQGLIE